MGVSVETNECPLENNFTLKESEVTVGLVQNTTKGKRWYCINPKHPRLMDDSGAFSKCFETECYYLRKVLRII